MARILGLLMVCCLVLKAGNPDLTQRDGFINVTGGVVWYKILGTGKGSPVLLVHGGPGGRSCRMEPMAELLGRERPVVLYDQLGGGRSTGPKDPTLWNLARFVKELHEVREALGLKELHLLGHSFGSTLVAEYLATYPRTGILSVVMSGPAISTPMWLADAAILRSRLPAKMQAVLDRHERAGTTDSPEYLEAASIYEKRHVFRRPDLTPATCDGAPPINETIYRKLWGPAEFFCNGELRSFDRTSILPTLQMPVLYLAGRFDEVLPGTLKRLRDMTPGSRLVLFENSGHLAFIEEKNQYAEVVGRFQREVEAALR